MVLPAVGGTEFDNFRLDEKNGTSLGRVLDLPLGAFSSVELAILSLSVQKALVELSSFCCSAE